MATSACEMRRLADKIEDEFLDQDGAPDIMAKLRETAARIEALLARLHMN
jgi:hypothetical protein